MPEDWKLTVKIMNLGGSLIGSFTIDVEDRLFSYKHLRQHITYEYYLKDLEDRLNAMKYNNSVEDKKIKSVL